MLYTKRISKALMPVHNVFKGKMQFLDSQTPKNTVLVAEGLIYWLVFSSTCCMQSFCTEKLIAAFKAKIGEVNESRKFNVL